MDYSVSIMTVTRTALPEHLKLRSSGPTGRQNDSLAEVRYFYARNSPKSGTVVSPNEGKLIRFIRWDAGSCLACKYP